jgi:hypothetical protein
MYISVDMESLRFVHKHPEQRVVLMLVDLELSHVATWTIPCDEVYDFETFTDLELLKLYRNATGSEHPGFSRAGLKHLCLATAQALPLSDVVAWEADMQLRNVTGEDRYRYIKGSMTPELLDELFEVPWLRTGSDVEAEAIAAAMRGVISTRAAAGAGTGRDRSAAAPIVARGGGARPVAAPRGGQRERIWAVADRMWEEQGKPDNVTRVLDLRKQMMNTLEHEGIKRASASSELGNWMKVRVPAK